jgi:WD40 repeat protein
MQLLKGHKRGVAAIVFSPNEQSLASCGLDRTVRLWNLATGEGTVTFEGSESSHAVCFSPDGRWFAWDARSEVRVQELDGDRQVAYPVAEKAGYVRALAWAPDARRVFCGMEASSEHKLDVLHLDAGPLGRFRWTSWPSREHGVQFLAFSPDGWTLATVHQAHGPKASGFGWRYFVVLWDVATCQERGRLEGHENLITAVDFSPDSRHLAVASGPTLWVWEAGSRTVVARIKAGVRHFKAVAFSPHGRWLVTARNDATVQFYHPQTWNEGPGLDWKVGPVISVAFARDGMRAACGSRNGKIVVWDMDD